MAAINLRRLLDDETRVYAYCRNALGHLRPPPACSHGATVDLARLIAKIGRDEVDLYGPEVQQQLVCKHCGSRGATFIVSVPSWSNSAGGRAAQEAKRRAEGG